MIREFPVPMAIGKDQRGIMAGKLNLRSAKREARGSHRDKDG